MSAILQERPSRDHVEGTLGALLYADLAKARVPEAEWVALVQAMAQGDTVALRGLYDRTHRLVFTLAFRLCGSRESAEEVALDVFHQAWLRASTYDPDKGTVVAWIMNQARSRALDRLRREQRKKRAGMPADPVDAGVTDATAPLAEADAARLLRGALLALSTEERQAIETAYFGDLTYAEAASRLGQPLGTIKTRIRSGIAKLRRALGGAAP